MAQTHAVSGEVVSVAPFGVLDGRRTSAIIKSNQLELIRIVLRAGEGLAEHSAPGEISVMCIEGSIVFRTNTGAVELRAGDLIHLLPNDPHSLFASEDSSALLTMCVWSASPASQ